MWLRPATIGRSSRSRAGAGLVAGLPRSEFAVGKVASGSPPSEFAVGNLAPERPLRYLVAGDLPVVAPLGKRQLNRGAGEFPSLPEAIETEGRVGKECYGAPVEDTSD